MTKKNKLAIVALLTCAALALFAGCSPQVTQELASSGETDAESADTFEWTAESDCTMCHSTQAASMEDGSCIAANHASVACLTCHDATEDLQKAHKKVEATDTDGTDELDRTSVGDEPCLSCHGSYEELATLTADYTELVDRQGKVVNPHDSPHVGQEEKVTCAACHKMHDEDGLANSGEVGRKACYSCHHDQVFECNTCHQ